MFKEIIKLILTCTLLFTVAFSLSSCFGGGVENGGDSGGGDNGQASQKELYTVTVLDAERNAVVGARVRLIPDLGDPIERVTDSEGKICEALEGEWKVKLISLPDGYKATDDQLNTALSFLGGKRTITVTKATYKFTVKDGGGTAYAGATVALYSMTNGEPDMTRAIATAVTDDVGVAYVYLDGGAYHYRLTCTLSNTDKLYVKDSYTYRDANEYELPVLIIPPISDNHIISAKFNEGAIQLTYKDNTKQSLGALSVRDGYNSAAVSYDFDSVSKILTLTLTDSSSINIASELLSETPRVMTVRLREMDGKLEWASESTDDWQTLCSAVTDEEIPLVLLAETVGFGKHGEISGDGVVFAINGNSLRFRAREWKNGIDFVMDASLKGVVGHDRFNITYLAEIDSSAPLGSTSASTLGYKVFKNAGDDITPIGMNGTYIGANHGYYVIAALPNDTGLTEVDIGSIWQVGAMQYVLVRVSSTRIWLCPYYESAMQTGSFAYYKIRSGDTVTHVSGATHTTPFTATADSTQQQFYHTLNHCYDAVFLNGVREIDLTKDGYYTAEFVDYYEEYDVIYLPAILKHLIANVGHNTNDSANDESITESYVTFHNTYRFHKNGACVVYSSYEFHKDVNISLIGGVQSYKFDEPTHYIYVPGVEGLSTPTLQPENTSINVETNDLQDPDTLASSYFQLTDQNGTKAINLGYNPLYGTAVNDARAKLLGENANKKLGYYYTSYKMYPWLISDCKLAAGDKVTFVAYRVPSYILDDDFIAINWYWVGDDIYLSLHTDKSLDKTVTVLPDYMNGMEISVVETSDNFTVNSSTIEDGSISVTSNGAGYVILKLSSP